ncbi:MAG: flagellin B [Helicobacteraceae bacterium]|nr:flagellin B [Helicobacteraceae bacterium]
MGFRIATNVGALNAQYNLNQTQNEMNKSLQRLSSGLRINSVSDDISGLTIANSLRSQANTLGQAIKNANDGIGILQIADKAMDEQVKILDTIKIKATQAAQDGQTATSREALQNDITRLMEELDNIAGTTSYNGQSLLSGSFTNKKFQIGASANQTIGISINSTLSSQIGNMRFETSSTITAMGTTLLNFTNIRGGLSVTLESVKLSSSAGTGLGVLSEVINKNSDLLGGVKASYSVLSTGASVITTGTITGLTLNGISLGDIVIDKTNDSNGALASTINTYSTDTGVTASVDSRGHLELNSFDGRAIVMSGANLFSLLGLGSSSSDKEVNVGRLSLTKIGSGDISLTSTLNGSNGDDIFEKSNMAEASTNLRSMAGAITADTASAMGFNANTNIVNIDSSKGSGVTTLHGAMAMMSIADSAREQLDSIRARVGSTQSQFEHTVSNISVTAVNLKAAESQIRDIDFAQESANFSKLNILAQSGTYALSQSLRMQELVLRLLQ